MYHDAQYIELLNRLINSTSGKYRTDRTGVGTASIFAEQMEFDVSEYFPLLTSKKTFFRGIAHELLWFISGNTNIDYLNSNGVKIWDAWANTSGQLGPVYGEMLRSYPPPQGCMLVDLRNVEDYTHVVLNNDKSVFGMATDGEYDATVADSCDVLLYNKWLDVMGSCYDTTHARHSIGTTVCNRWLSASNFIIDAKKIPQYFAFKKDAGVFSLDTSYYGNSNMYHPDTCVWLRNNQMVHGKQLVSIKIHNDQSLHYFNNLGKCADYLNVSPSVILESVSTGTPICGYVIEQFESDNKIIQQFLAKDQLQDVLDGISNDPTSRRLILSYWHPSLVPDESKNPMDNVEYRLQALPPCHHALQFYCDGDSLSLKFTMRSSDVFLGLPFNIAQYALLLYMIGRLTSRQPDKLIWSGGDIHLYQNHRQQAITQASRTLIKSPKLTVSSSVTDINNFKMSDIHLDGYTPHPALSVPIAV